MPEVKRYFWEHARKKYFLLHAGWLAFVLQVKTAIVQKWIFARCSLYPITLEETCRLV